jgi:hypothetical protein
MTKQTIRERAEADFYEALRLRRQTAEAQKRDRIVKAEADAQELATTIFGRLVDHLDWEGVTLLCQMDEFVLVFHPGGYEHQQYAGKAFSLLDHRCPGCGALICLGSHDYAKRIRSWAGFVEAAFDTQATTEGFHADDCPTRHIKEVPVGAPAPVVAEPTLEQKIVALLGQLMSVHIDDHVSDYHSGDC